MNSAVWIFVILIIIVLFGLFIWPQPFEFGNPTPTDDNGGVVACTMEAKLCPDGSYVGRQGPNCEFAACPSGPSTSTDININASGSLNGS